MTPQDLANRANQTSNSGQAGNVFDEIQSTVGGFLESFGSGLGQGQGPANVTVENASVGVGINPNMLIVAGIVAVVLLMKGK
jgi:hypothetical protein